MSGTGWSLPTVPRPCHTALITAVRSRRSFIARRTRLSSKGLWSVARITGWNDVLFTDPTETPGARSRVPMKATGTSNIIWTSPPLSAATWGVLRDVHLPQLIEVGPGHVPVVRELHQARALARLELD